MTFLADIELRPLVLQDGQGLRPIGLALGKASQALEVAITEAVGRPTAGALKAAWRSRVSGRATPVLLVAPHSKKTSFCGPTGDNPPAFFDQDAGYIEQICRIALSEPDRHAALRFLQSALKTIETPLPGLRNEGLVVSHAVEQ